MDNLLLGFFATFLISLDSLFSLLLSVTSLQKLVLHRHAMVDPDPSSVISLWLQDFVGFKGLSIEPNRTSVLKHSRIVAAIMIVITLGCF